MKELASEDILTLWSNTKLQTGVYVHSPFCKEQCTYCTYKGTMFEKDAFHRYYTKYLPDMIKFYEPILSSNLIRNYFWGGGTPTLMSAEIMNNIFELIPNFKQTKRKLMEFHMADWNNEQLDVVKEYNFNTVVACVQSFDKEVVKQQKRRTPKNDTIIFDFIDYANSLGLFTMSDVIFFYTGNLNKDLDRLSSDIQKLANHNISEITIQTIHGEKGVHREHEGGQFDAEVSKRITKFLNDNNQYWAAGWEDETEPPYDYYCDRQGRKHRKELKVYKKEIDWDEMSQQDIHLDGLYTNPAMLLSTNYNVLGIGSYKNYKHTFSRIGDELEYIEDGDTYKPKWVCTYDKKDWPMEKLVGDFFKKLSNTIGDPPDGIDFTFGSFVDQSYEDNRDKKKIERKLMVDYRWLSGESFVHIDEYIPKLKKVVDGTVS